MTDHSAEKLSGLVRALAGRWEMRIYLLILAVALGTRLWDVGGKALHYDEILHAWYAWRYAEGMGYSHTPLTHGPFLFHAAAATYTLLGSSDFTSRLLPALFGAALVGLPYFLRHEMGRSGALLASVFLTVLPSTLYMSRFMRNDIYMAVWVLGLVIVMWRYIDRPRNGLLMAWVVLWALAFTTKESSFIVAAILALALMSLSWRELVRLVRRRQQLANLSPSGVLLLVLMTLTLPLWAPAAGLIQDLLGIVLVNADPNDPVAGATRATSHVGLPAAAGFWTAMTITLALLVTTLVLGVLSKWRQRQWLPAALATFTTLTGLLIAGWVALLLRSSTSGRGLFGQLQDSLESWILQQPVDTGSPVGGGLVVAAGLVLSLGGVALLLGLLWDRRRWPCLAFVFGVPLLLLFTSMGTNWQGLFTGLWGSLGYWIAQQPVERAGQPWFFYFVTSGTYEFLVFVPAMVGIVILARRSQPFDRFLAYWAAVTFITFSFAGEKMPWLTVGVTLPMAMVAARITGILIEHRPWVQLGAGRALTALAAGPMLVLGAVVTLLRVVNAESLPSLNLATGLSVLMAAGLGIAVMAARSALGRVAGMAFLGSMVLLLGASVLVAGRASYSYQEFEMPRELLVYSQTGQETSYTMNLLDDIAKTSGKGRTGLRFLVGESDNFAWQWRWYLRNYPQVEIRSLNDQPLTSPPDVDVVLFSKTVEGANQAGLKGFSRVGDLNHLWWFPKAAYESVTPASFADSLTSREGWRGALDYLLSRQLDTPMHQSRGSVYVADQYVDLALGR